MEKQRYVKSALGFCAGLLAGFFGSGGGAVVVEGLERGGMDEKRSHAVSVAVIFPISALAAALYISGGHVPLVQTLWLCGGAAAGGVLGALFLRRAGKKLLNRVFTLLMLASGIRMLF